MSSTNNDTQRNVSLWYFYTFLILMIITGSINTIANKLQNISISLGEKYNHSYFITFLMFLGESLCLIIYTFEKKKGLNQNNQNNNITRNDHQTNPNNQIIQNNNENPENQILLHHPENQNQQNTQNEINSEPFNEENPEATPMMLILPTLCDFFASTIMTIGLTMLAGSTYQMMRGSLILFTALFSRIFLKNKLYLHHYIALIFSQQKTFLIFFKIKNI